MAQLHEFVAYLAIGMAGVTGLLGVFYAISKRPEGQLFVMGRWVAVGAMLVQGTIGLVLFAGDGDPGSAHMFYGMVIAAALAFGYIYRSQFERRPSLAWSLLLLFLMGSGIRAFIEAGSDFGG